MTLDAYADLDTFRLFIRAAEVASEDDDPDSAVEALALEAGARAIDRACGRDFRVAAAEASARYFTAAPADEHAYFTVPMTRHHRRYACSIDDLQDITGLAVELDGTATSAYTLGPLTSSYRGLPYTELVFDEGIYPEPTTLGVKVTAKWGWTATPNAIVNANLLQASRFLKRRDAPFGVAGSPDMGSEVRLLAKLDPDVELMVSGYKRRWGAAV